MKQSAVATIYERTGRTDAVHGRVVVAWRKASWMGVIYATALAGGAVTFAWDALVVCVGLSAVTLCLGHSLGMHRLLIHRSYECP